MTETITPAEVWAELLTARHSGADQLRREVQLPTGDDRIVATAAVRDRDVEITVRWPGVWERRVTAQVRYSDFEIAFLDSAPDSRWYTTARIAETARDVAVGLARALTATEGRLPVGWSSAPCQHCGGSGRQTVTLSDTGAAVPQECWNCDGAGERIALDGAAEAAAHDAGVRL